MRAQRLATIVISCLVIASANWVGAQESSAKGMYPVDESNLRVIDLVELKYPPLAPYAPLPAEGVVVIRVSLQDDGTVREAAAISGNDALIPDCLTNVKKWHFQPNAAKIAIVVYNLRMLEGECKSPLSLFTFQQPNFATILGCFPAVDNSFKPIRLQDTTVLSDLDLEALHVDKELRYPGIANAARIQGIVVVQARLDDRGNVGDVSALSGKPMLVPGCLDNARKWRFRPNTERMAIIVYNFKPVVGDVGQFIFQPPNFVTVTASPVTVQTSGQR